MRGQFATIEALSSLLIALSALSIGSQIINNSQQSLVLQRDTLGAKAAAYDFLTQVLKNQSTLQCVLNSSNKACMGNYSNYYQKIYGIRELGIANASKSENYSNIYCEQVSNQTVCIGVS